MVISTLTTSSTTFNNTTSSTGTCPAGWRQYWRRQAEIDGTTWRDIAELNVAAIDRFLATSSFWVSS
jgi:hypothetical protein